VKVVLKTLNDMNKMAFEISSISNSYLFKLSTTRNGMGLLPDPTVPDLKITYTCRMTGKPVKSDQKES
jgi:hypothetical protein